LQQTKREKIDQNYVKQFCPRQFDCFEYVPSVGAAGGIMVFWRSSKFSGAMIFQNAYAMNI
jgi:hypothetical protein